MKDFNVSNFYNTRIITTWLKLEAFIIIKYVSFYYAKSSVIVKRHCVQWLCTHPAYAQWLNIWALKSSLRKVKVFYVPIIEPFWYDDDFRWMNVNDVNKDLTLIYMMAKYIGLCHSDVIRWMHLIFVYQNCRGNISTMNMLKYIANL